MSDKPTWMVRADKSGTAFADFEDNSVVGIGWSEMGNVSGLKRRDAVLARYHDIYKGAREQRARMDAGQIDRFMNRFAPGDRVVTYDPSTRVYLCGTIDGAPVYDPDAGTEVLTYTRPVSWTHRTGRDDLSAAARASLGSISAIFSVRTDVSAELWKESKPAPAASGSDDDGRADQAPDLETLANEAIKDMLAALSWDDMQELVAGLLRAMGFKTRISGKGSDRGKDVVASPDGFGFREPRIFVEVKHRTNQTMGSQDIRSFLGGRRPGDKGLYVSTGGFTKDAYYEAERANVPTTLMDFEELVHAIQEHYDAFDLETKQLLPLKPIFAPALQG
ncbi:MAG: restriction endonuclease [Pseudomonadota bacterium]